MRGENDVIEPRQRMVRRRFLFSEDFNVVEGVQGGAGQVPASEQTGERAFVRDGAAAGIDEIGTGFHFFQVGLIQQAVGVRCERQVQRDKVRRSQ